MTGPRARVGRAQTANGLDVGAFVSSYLIIAIAAYSLPDLVAVLKARREDLPDLMAARSIPYRRKSPRRGKAVR